MKNLIILFLLAITTRAFSQDWPLRKIVTDKKERGISFIRTSGFRLLAEKKLNAKSSYKILQIDAAFSKQLLNERPGAIQVTVPLDSTETIVCELVKLDLGNVVFTKNNKETGEHIKAPISYQGVVAGESQKNTVVLTVNEDYLSLIVSMPRKTIQVTKADETAKTSYRIYNSDKMMFPVYVPDCGTVAASSPATASLPSTARVTDFIDSAGGLQDSNAHKYKCVNVFIDCLDSLYLSKGSSMQKTINFAYELFAEAAAGYTNEEIKIQVSVINVWTTPDPFNTTSRDSGVATVTRYYQDNFYGNIGVALDFGNVGKAGIASKIGAAKSYMPNGCTVYQNGVGEFAYDDLNYNVNTKNFPAGPNTTGPQIYSLMHEMGHLLNAHHTKWCGWQLSANPLTFGALDSCGTVEGTCTKGPPPPPGGATIMSYCVTGDTTTQFVNYFNGFGLLPGNAIRNFVGQTNCIDKCVSCIVFDPRTNTNQQYAVAGAENHGAPGQRRTSFLLLPFPKSKR